MTIKDDVLRTHGEHPEWTARQIADHLRIDRHHVYNNARTAGLTLAAAPLAPIPRRRVAPVEPVKAAPSDFIVYANNPADMVGAQASTIEWCGQKIQAEAHELAEAERNLHAAIDNGWSPAGWERQRRLIRQKLDFYEKVKLALEAGYYIVPPFPVDIFAIRTDRRSPNKKTTTYSHSAHLQEPQMLAAGKGRYVSNRPETFLRDVDGMKDGKPTIVTQYFAKDFREADFPFTLAKAEIMSATRAAMALGVFDQMGALPGKRAPDPIICGQILMPHRGRQPLTFFVSWWLDTRTL